MTLDEILRQFENVDANLDRIEKSLGRIEELEQASVSTGYTFEDCYEAIQIIWAALPKIDGWKPEISIYDSNEKALMRFDAQEVCEPHAFVAVENEINRAEKTITEYRRRVRQKRIALTRERILQLAEDANRAVMNLKRKLSTGEDEFSNERSTISDAVKQIDVLLGDAFKRPPRWGDLRRHLGFWKECDMNDIVEHDWPSVFPVLNQQLYTDDEPLPVETSDLGAIAVNEVTAPVTTQLGWESLDSDSFERLIYNLITHTKGYSNPKWLMRTNAPDRGRDISAEHTYEDPLSGLIHSRIIIQCKHWRAKSISVEDIAALKEQIKLWEPPTVNVVIVATSGRFTADAVTSIERHNQTGSPPRIDMWPESHLEMLLAQRPALVASFHLR